MVKKDKSHQEDPSMIKKKVKKSKVKDIENKLENDNVSTTPLSDYQAVKDDNEVMEMKQRKSRKKKHKEDGKDFSNEASSKSFEMIKEPDETDLGKRKKKSKKRSFEETEVGGLVQGEDDGKEDTLNEAKMRHKKSKKDKRDKPNESSVNEDELSNVERGKSNAAGALGKNSDNEELQKHKKKKRKDKRDKESEFQGSNADIIGEDGYIEETSNKAQVIDQVMNDENMIKKHKKSKKAKKEKTEKDEYMKENIDMNGMEVNNDKGNDGKQNSKEIETQISVEKVSKETTPSNAELNETGAESKVSKKAKKKKKMKGTENSANDVSEIVDSEEKTVVGEIGASDEVNSEGILSQMETSRLKKIKQKTDKPKTSKTADKNEKNEQVSLDAESAKKKKKPEDTEGISEISSSSVPADGTEKSIKDYSVEYLLQWKKDRSNWSFKKVRQTWLLRNMYKKSQISDKHFKILLKYLKELKGNSREITLAKAKEILEKESGKANADDDAEKVSQLRALEITRILS